jgi:hypothetical protein
MPTLFIFFGIRFYFFSNEHLPIHVHIENGDGNAKIEVETLKVIKNSGIKSKDIYLAISIIEENKDLIKQRWLEYFGSDNKII